MEIHETLKRFRNQKNVSQNEICEVLKIKQQQYSTYETGKHLIKVDQIKKICEHYNVSADYLLGLTDEYRPLHTDENEKNLI